MRPRSRFLLAVTSSLIVAGFLSPTVHADESADAPGRMRAPTVGTTAAALATAEEGSTPDLLADDVRSGAITQDAADRILAAALSGGAVPADYRSHATWDGTMTMLALQQRAEAGDLPADVARTLGFSGSDASERTTSRAKDGDSSRCGGTGPFPKIATTKFFKIHFDPRRIANPLSMADYKSSVNRAFKREVQAFGWWKPPQKGNAGSKYHVYVANLGSGLYGFVTTGGTYAGKIGNNPHSPWPDKDAYATCMVLNDNYKGFPSKPRGALDATSAHEYNHSLQFGIGGLTGSNAPTIVWTEAGATYMEDEVWDTANDSWYYLYPEFDLAMARYPDFPYSYWIVYRAIVEQYGTGSAGGGQLVMRTFWELVSRRIASNLGAWEQALLDAQGGDLADDYHEASIAMKFLKKCQGGYVYPYCLEEANGYRNTAGTTSNTAGIGSIGTGVNGSVPDNYALNWIGLPSAGTYDVDITNTSGGGQFAVSVVCDTGAMLDILVSSTLAGGQMASVTVNANACVTRPIAVVSNVTRTGGDNPFSADRNYSVDTSP